MTYSGWEFNRPAAPSNEPEEPDKPPTIAERIAKMGVLPCTLNGEPTADHPNIKGLKND